MGFSSTAGRETRAMKMFYSFFFLSVLVNLILSEPFEISEIKCPMVIFFSCCLVCSSCSKSVSHLSSFVSFHFENEKKTGPWGLELTFTPWACPSLTFLQPLVRFCRETLAPGPRSSSPFPFLLLAAFNHEEMFFSFLVPMGCERLTA